MFPLPSSNQGDLRLGPGVETAHLYLYRSAQVSFPSRSAFSLSHLPRCHIKTLNKYPLWQNSGLALQCWFFQYQETEEYYAGLSLPEGKQDCFLASRLMWFEKQDGW